MGGAGGGRDDRTLVEDDLLAIRTVARGRAYHGHDHIADLHAGGDAVAHLIDDPCRIHAGDIGWRVSLLLFCARAVAGHRVGRVHRRRMDPQPHLPWARMHFRYVHNLQDLGSAVCYQSHCPHYILPFNRSLVSPTTVGVPYRKLSQTNGRAIS